MLILLLVECKKKAEYCSSNCTRASVYQLWVCLMMCSPSGERTGWGNKSKTKTNSFPCPREIILLIALAFVSFADSVLQIFLHAKRRQNPLPAFSYCPTLDISNFWYSGHSFSAVFASGYNVLPNSTWMIKVWKKNSL